MKQATVKLPSGEFCFQEVPVTRDWDGCEIRGRINRNSLLSFYGQADAVELPPGSWQLLGADPTRLTEEEAGEIVESYNDGCLFCRDYSLKTHVFGIKAIASLDSLAASLGIEKPYIILKLKTDNNGQD